ncbi:MAG TPA: amidohydrolase family protein, partial [archaeon]|nr:amidohydrolase family protein [archaeon]
DLASLSKLSKSRNDDISRQSIVGIKIYTGYEHIFANDKLCYKIAEMCETAKIPLLFHSGDCWSGASQADAHGASTLQPKVRFAHPLYIDDVAVDFPDINIIICHFGNPWLMDTAEVLYKNKNVYADLSALDVNKPWDSIRERLMEAIEFSQASDRLLFGTDFPLFQAADQIKKIRSLGLSKQDIENTFHVNAEKIFKI